MLPYSELISHIICYQALLIKLAMMMKSHHMAINVKQQNQTVQARIWFMKMNSLHGHENEMHDVTEYWRLWQWLVQMKDYRTCIVMNAHTKYQEERIEWIEED